MENARGSLPEIVFDTDTSFTPEAVGKLVQQGQLRKLGPKLYTSNLIDPPEAIVGRQIFVIAGHFFPGAVVGYRTALEEAPSPDGIVCLSYHRSRKVSLPGHTIKLIQGPGPLPGDRPYVGELHIASPARALLENLVAAESHNDRALAVPPEALEAYLRAVPEAERGPLRDKARELAAQCRWKDEFKLLEDMLDSAGTPANGGFKAAWSRLQALGSRSRSSLSQFGGAFAQNSLEPETQTTEPRKEPAFDADRLRLFQALFRVLRERTYAPRPLGDVSPGWEINRAFFEAYFSNYLAGAELELEDAHRAVMENKPLEDRPLDSGILLNTFHLIESGGNPGPLPARDAEFLDSLTRGHEALFAGSGDSQADRFRRTDAPGFVAPKLIRGTLIKGFNLYRELQEPFARAAFMLFLVRESHPFDEGSGRLARVMMNAELSAAGEMRILIPPVYAGDYWLAQRALSRDSDPEPYVRVLLRSHAFSTAIDFSYYDAALRQLEESNALMQPDKRNRVYEP